MSEPPASGLVNRGSLCSTSRLAIRTGLAYRERGGGDHTTQIRVAVPSAARKSAVGKSSTSSPLRPGVCSLVWSSPAML
jgi:hypothetical protein